jgi:hypothetical protein
MDYKIISQQDQTLEDSEELYPNEQAISVDEITTKYPPKKKHVQKASHNPKKNLLKLSEALKTNLLRRKIKKQS